MLTIAIVMLPWLVIVPAALLDPRVRTRLRAPVTRWLDRYDPGASAG